MPRWSTPTQMIDPTTKRRKGYSRPATAGTVAPGAGPRRCRRVQPLPWWFSKRCPAGPTELILGVSLLGATRAAEGTPGRRGFGVFALVAQVQGSKEGRSTRLAVYEVPRESHDPQEKARNDPKGRGVSKRPPHDPICCCVVIANPNSRADDHDEENCPNAFAHGGSVGVAHFWCRNPGRTQGPCFLV